MTGRINFLENIMIRATFLLVFVSFLIFPGVGFCSGDASTEIISTDPASLAVLAKKLVKPAESIDSKIAKKHAKKYEGIWVYKLTGAKGKPARDIILRGKCNDAGQLKFSFLDQVPFTGAVFEKCSVDQFRANAYFKLENKQSVMYSLVRKKQTLSCTIHLLSIKEQKVSLRKITLAQAIVAIENNSRKTRYLTCVIDKFRAVAQLEKEKYRETLAKLDNRIKGLYGQNREWMEKHAKLLQGYKRLNAELNDVRNSKLVVEKRNQAVIKELADKVSKISLELEKFSSEIADPANLQEVIAKGTTLGSVEDQVTGIDSALGCYVWQILYDLPQATSIRIRSKHAVAGDKGAFRFTAWCDTDGNGIPDTKIGNSELMIAENKDDWSDWEFVSKGNKVFVGVILEKRNSIYYQYGGKLKGYFGLSNKLFYSKSPKAIPVNSVQPRYINLRIEILEVGGR